jgi:oligoribonuclease (3'-5' exoribonuclease)
MERTVTRLAFIDTETTGLDPDLHEIWEVALILRDDGHHLDREYTWQLPVDLGKADPMALKIGRFHERRVAWDETADLEPFAEQFAELTRGAHLVGNVISFDEERLRRLLRRMGQCPMWHYHLVDVEAMAAGWIGRIAYKDDIEDAAWGYVTQPGPPWDSKMLSLAVGIDPESYEKHTARGDARWARDMYDAVVGPWS